MKELYHLSTTEAEIMDKLWAQDGPIRQTRLLEMFLESGKEWGRQTLNTLLIRLENRNFVKREKRMVWAVYSKAEFGKLIISETVKTYFDGNWQKMLKECKKER